MIRCGPASVRYEVGNDRLARASWTGLVVPANAGQISAMLLEAGVRTGATGVIGSLAGTVLALPPVTSKYYEHVPSGLLDVPVAIVLSPEQAWLYEEVATEAALSGATRRAFLSFEQGEAWLRQQARALVANRAWWSLRRSRR